MQFLKKVSYIDILGKDNVNQFHYYEDITAKYKEFELFLTEEHLEELLPPDESPSFKKMVQILKNNGAVIKAIHCPESTKRTCNEKDGELSGNYLSLCEVINDEDSGEMLKKVLVLANKICEEQSQNNNAENEPEDDEEDSTYRIGKENEDQVIVILHEGCEKGCSISNSIEKDDCNFSDEKVVSLLKNMNEEINYSIKIVLENITPFYSNKIEIERGRNCGWKSENQKSTKDFFCNINDRLKKEKINIQFGSCIDLCHIMVSSKIMNEKKTKSEALISYFEKIDYSEYIYLFHISNYGEEDWSHGKLFSFENEEDKNAMETIRILCSKYAPKAPITFEMADGRDMEKAALNYEHIMLYFSNKHMFGKFGELLNADSNKELKSFFDNLYVIYSYDKKSVFEITNSLWHVKQIILKNTFEQNKEERLFGVDFDKNKVELSLVRLKAYVYYTRFCNLGNYLAENYYSGDKCIWDSNENIAEDFGLAMKYFIFNDQIHQCVYTGIQYKFLIDFLPKKETFVRFNDGIVSVREMKCKQENLFSNIVGKIPGHINGDSIKDIEIIKEGKSIKGKEADFYSVGKNFGQCLFKYFDSAYENWSLKIYENTPVNYVEYKGRIYSIQAFTQLALINKDFISDKYNISLDISRFASGRDGKSTDTLRGFIKLFNKNSGLSKKPDLSLENAGSIADEEILFTALPQTDNEYTLSDLEGIILKVMCLSMIGKKEDELPNKIVFNNKENEKDTDELNGLRDKIDEINNDRNHKIWKIVSKMKDTLSKTQRGVENLDPYSGDFNKRRYDELKEYISFEREDKKNEQ